MGLCTPNELLVMLHWISAISWPLICQTVSENLQTNRWSDWAQIWWANSLWAQVFSMAWHRPYLHHSAEICAVWNSFNPFHTWPQQVSSLVCALNKDGFKHGGWDQTTIILQMTFQVYLIWWFLLRQTCWHLTQACCDLMVPRTCLHWCHNLVASVAAVYKPILTASVSSIRSGRIKGSGIPWTGCARPGILVNPN